MPSVVQALGWWTRPVSFLERARARYGKRFTIRQPATPPFVMLSEPAELKQVFTAPPEVLHPGEGARILEPVVGRHSVILLDEDAHLEQRKLMLPAFHGERMERLTGLMEEVAEREVASWPRHSPLAMHPRLQALTLEIILRAVFGVDPGSRFDRLHELMNEILDFGLSPAGVFPPLQRSLGGRGAWARFERVRAEADEMLLELIRERRAEGADRDDVLAMLVEARHEDGTPMSDAEIRDELMTLLVAGHETTASSLGFAFTRLPHEPRVLDRLTAEIDGGDGDAYLTATIQETLRRRPVLSNSAPRLVVRPIEVGDWEYPPGAFLLPSAYLLHHDPDVYEEPYAFRPERFLDEAPGTYTWIPFGGGRRRCLGASFALLEMKVVLRASLRALRPAPAGVGIERMRRRGITISPGNGATAVLHDRAGAPVGERQPAAA